MLKASNVMSKFDSFLFSVPTAAWLAALICKVWCCSQIKQTASVGRKIHGWDTALISSWKLSNLLGKD